MASWRLCETRIQSQNGYFVMIWSLRKNQVSLQALIKCLFFFLPFSLKFKAIRDSFQLANSPLQNYLRVQIFFFGKHSESDMEVHQATLAGDASLDLQHNAVIFCSTQDLQRRNWSLDPSFASRFQFPKALQPLIITFERFKVLLLLMPRNAMMLSIKLRTL